MYRKQEPSANQTLQDFVENFIYRLIKQYDPMIKKKTQVVIHWTI